MSDPRFVKWVEDYRQVALARLGKRHGKKYLASVDFTDPCWAELCRDGLTPEETFDEEMRND